MNYLNRFNWIARNYDKLVNVFFGKTLHQAQMNFVSEIGAADKVLILGGGSGKFLKDLLAIRPSIAITYIEASSEMIMLAKGQIKEENPKVKFIHGTQDHIPLEQFDAVITNFFLDLFREDEMRTLVDTISKKLNANGKWFVADFENTQKFSHRFLLWFMYLFFRSTGSIETRHLPEWRLFFKDEGLKLKAEKFFNDGFVSASVFVKQLATGVPSVHCRSSELTRPSPP
jgi:ubiquinone/menaquinone biosynthesis C-methylase UbiE